MDNTNVILVHKETIVNLCDTYRVYITQGGEHAMILDPGAPVSLVGIPWLCKFLAEFDYKIEDLVSSECHQVFLFGGIDKRYKSKFMIVLLLMLRST